MKTFIINIALLCMILISASGCIDDFGDWGMMNVDLSGYGGSYYNGNYVPPPYTASFFVDSVTQESDSTIKIWAKIRYDSVLIINNHSVRYLDDTGTEISQTLQSIPDTINFRNLTDSTLAWTGRYEWAYHYSLEVDSLKKDFDYNMYLSSGYTEKGILKSTQNWIFVRLK